MKQHEISSYKLIREMSRLKEQAEKVNTRIEPHLQCDSWRGLLKSIGVFILCATVIFLATVPGGLWIVLVIVAYLFIFSLCVVAKRADKAIEKIKFDPKYATDLKRGVDKP